MEILFNSKTISSVDDIDNEIKNTDENFSIEVIVDDENQLQILKDDDGISVIKTEGEKQNCSYGLKKANIKKIINKYLNNNEAFKLKWNADIRGLLEAQSKLKSSCNKYRNMFFLFLILTIVVMAIVINRPEYQGSIIMKIYQFYLDSSANLKVKFFPVIMIFFLISYIVTKIRIWMEVRKALNEEQ